MTEIKKILFPFDLSENASKIVPYVLSVADAYNGTICLFHVVQDLHRWGKLYIPHTSMDILQKEASETAGKALDRICEEQFQGCPNLEKRVAYGDAAAEILKTIGSEDIDMVIMSTHGRKGLEHIIMGSVVENVVKRSPVPVMTINPYKLKE